MDGFPAYIRIALGGDICGRCSRMIADGGGSIGLVHDYLLTLRGAERSFAAIADLWPEAAIYTSLYSRSGTGGRFDGHAIQPSFLQRIGVDQKRFRGLLPLFPRAIERLDVKHLDVIVSSSSAFAHGIRPRADATHVCYCYSPFRYAWFERHRALNEAPRGGRALIGGMLDRIQRWDVDASTRVTHYVSIGKLTQDRVADYYGRDSVIVHPPVETRRFSSADPEDYFLFVGEVTRHKRVEVALRAAERAETKIKIVGDGPDRERLEARYAGAAEFLGRVDDGELNDLYSRTLALIVPNVEEFGIAAVEAQAAGRPVVALGRGGALETIRDGVTGVLVSSPLPDAFAEALREIDFTRFDPAAAVANADLFSVEAFQRRIRKVVLAAASGRAVATRAPEPVAA